MPRRMVGGWKLNLTKDSPALRRKFGRARLPVPRAPKSLDHYRTCADACQMSGMLITMGGQARCGGEPDSLRGPAHARIEGQLSRAISAGDLRLGDRLPPERELAAELGVSRMTLRQALDTLARRGLVHRIVGRHGGTFVSQPRLERDLSTFLGLSDQLRRQGSVPGARLLSASLAEANVALAAALACPPGTPLYDIARLRLADDRPVAIERSYFPAAAFPGLLSHPLEGSIYEVMRSNYHDVPHRAVERLEATVASAEECAILDVAEGSPLMLVERTAYGAGESPLEFSRELYRADRMRAVVWIDDLGTPTEKRTSLGPERQPPP
jgi:GntR family transcriptional regulator